MKINAHESKPDWFILYDAAGVMRAAGRAAHCVGWQFRLAMPEQAATLMAYQSARARLDLHDWHTEPPAADLALMTDANRHALDNWERQIQQLAIRLNPRLL